jgi:hypothetical protein
MAYDFKSITLLLEEIKNRLYKTKQAASSGGSGTGDASAANQLLGNTSLSSINTKLPTLVSGKIPVDVGGAVINITGPVTVSNEVEIKNDTGNPIPVNGTVSVNAGTNLNTSALALETTQSSSNTKLTTINTTLGTPFQAGGAISNTGFNVNNFPATQPISAVSLPLPTGGATSALQSTQDTSINTLLKPSSTLNAVTTLGTITNALPVGANIIGKISIDQTTQGTTNFVTNNNTQIKGVAVATGIGNVDTGTQRIVLASDQPILSTKLSSTTPTQSSVTASITNTTLLVSNISRTGATIYNDSNSTLYLKLGATASISSFSVILKADGGVVGAGGYYEIPYGYTGIIDGIWTSAVGNARITSLN